ncbi:MAG: hypothetical protein QM733_20490 [Ilumatobacteraceae bacterium]
MTDAGVPITHEEALRRWRPWTPDEVARRLAGVRCWAVVGGWAIDLFLGRTTREHEDIEISVPAASFAEVVAALPGFEWDVAGDGCLWPYPAALGEFRQTWLREPGSEVFVLDVFREQYDETTWVCRHDPTIVLPYGEAHARRPSGIHSAYARLNAA